MADTALAIIQGGAKGHPSAVPWYSTHPVEPIGGSQSVVVGTHVTLASMSLDSIMDTIIAKKPDNVLVVSHGYAGGLAIPLHKDVPVGLDVDKVILLSADRQFEYDGVKTPRVADGDIVKALSEEMARMLRDKMNLIRAMGLNHVGFRACDLGENVMPFREFFGAKSVSAPKFKDMYGYAPVEIGGNHTKWMERKRKVNRLNQTWIDGDLVFAYLKLSSTQFKISVRAKSRAALQAWAKQNISTSSGADKTILFHGMEDPNANSGTASIHFVLDQFFMSNIYKYPK